MFRLTLIGVYVVLIDKAEKIIWWINIFVSMGIH